MAMRINSSRASRCVNPSPEVVTLIARSYLPKRVTAGGSVVVVVLGFPRPSAVTNRERLLNAVMFDGSGDAQERMMVDGESG